jgi:hypothetical protein
MPKQIYKVTWRIKCLDLEFVTNQWKVFDSKAEALAYGYQWQNEANEGLSPCERAEDGYCYEFTSAYPVDEVDGYEILLSSKERGSGSTL